LIVHVHHHLLASPHHIDNSYRQRKSGSLPIWDARTLLIGKKGIENTEGIKLSVTDHHCKKQNLLECTVPATDFPAAGEDWKDFVYTPEDSKHVKDVELLYKIRVTNCEDKISGRDDLGSFLVDTESISYSEEVIKGEEKVDNALLQCWRQKEPASKAVLWILGRNDCFMHPNIAKELFTEKGYDLYVLNYSANGMCRKRGWVVSSDTSIGHHFLPTVFTKKQTSLKHLFSSALLRIAPFLTLTTGREPLICI
jgi:hypothetical protein